MQNALIDAFDTQADGGKKLDSRFEPGFFRVLSFKICHIFGMPKKYVGFHIQKYGKF